ncbi:unnamed protein product [Caenorhabditis brenneri]
MTEYLKTAPDALDTCVRYETIRLKSKNDAYTSVVKTLVGVKEAAELEMMTRQMGNWDLIDRKEKSPETLIRNDKQALHYCILYEFVQKKPIGQAYKSICSLLGKDVIDFLEFKIRFERFKIGKYSMIDGEKIDGEGATGNEPSLGDMPTEIAEKIVENLDLMDRLSVRKVCRNLRSIVDTLEVHCDQLQISVADRLTIIRIGSNPPIEYQYSRGNNCQITFKGKKRIVNSDHISVEFQDLASFMQNPKFKLGKLKTGFLLGVPFAFEYGYIPVKDLPIMRFAYIEEFFKDLGHRLHVSSFDIEFEIHGDDDDVEPVMSILPYLKPGVLEKIRIKKDFDFKEMMQKVIELPQWKQAKELDMRRARFTSPLKNLLNFRKFVVFVPKLDDEQCIEIVKEIFKMPSFESCELHCYDDELNYYYILDSFEQYYIEDSRSLYKSPNGQIFEIRVSDDSIRIKKM